MLASGDAASSGSLASRVEVSSNAVHRERVPVKPVNIDNLSRMSSELEQGLIALHLSLAPSQQQQLLDYLALLSKWNKTHNLTAVRDPHEMVRRHLLDSLSIHRYVDGLSVLDVGSGAGLPGIPLAVANPRLNVTLVDSVVKKTRFMQFAAAELGLSNVRVCHERVEKMSAEPGFDIIVARAFSSPEKLCRLTAHLLMPGGKILAMIGHTPGSPQALSRTLVQNDDKTKNTVDKADSSSTGESWELPGFTVIKMDKLFVPGETAERNIVVLQLSVD